MKKETLVIFTNAKINKINEWYSFSCKFMKTEKNNFLLTDIILVEGYVPSGYYCESACDKLPCGKNKTIENTDFDVWKKGKNKAPESWLNPKQLKKKKKKMMIKKNPESEKAEIVWPTEPDRFDEADVKPDNIET